MNDPLDEKRCDFLEHSGAEYADTEFRARLVDDIADNGQRELTPSERYLADRMMLDHANDPRRRRLQ